jgi:hypothetical protein
MKIGWKVRGAVISFRDMVERNVQCPIRLRKRCGVTGVQRSIQTCDAESLSAIGRAVFDVGCSAFPVLISDFRRLTSG